VVNKRLVEETKRLVGIIDSHRAPIAYGSFGARGATAPLVVGEDIPVVVDIKDFQYTYKCKHCGHI
jgi:hypothetical protein